jgi:hypothetical protein
MHLFCIFQSDCRLSTSFINFKIRNNTPLVRQNIEI